MKIKCVLKGANFPDFRLDYFFFSLIGVQLPIFAFFFANYSGRRWERERERELSAPARRWWCTLEIRNFRLVRQRGSLCAHIHVTHVAWLAGPREESAWNNVSQTHNGSWPVRTTPGPAGNLRGRYLRRSVMNTRRHRLQIGPCFPVKRDPQQLTCRPTTSYTPTVSLVIQKRMETTIWSAWRKKKFSEKRQKCLV